MDSWKNIAADLGLELGHKSLQKSAELISQYPMIDIHTHPGRFFARGNVDVHPSLAFMLREFVSQSLEDIRAGGLSTACFATVGDLVGIKLDPERGLSGIVDVNKDLLRTDNLRQIDILQSLIDSKEVSLILEADDIFNAKEEGKIGALLTCEGADFMQGRLEDVGQMYLQGIRSISLLHYRVNELGDIQTEKPVHNGLTDFGRQVVAEMNQFGMLVDAVHANKATTRDICEMSSQPVMLSHSNLISETCQHPRLLDPEHAHYILGQLAARAHLHQLLHSHTWAVFASYQTTWAIH